MPITVIIPAHNEANVIARCLESILRDASYTEMELIVVCNGCTDSTAPVARGFGTAVRVIETDIALKVNALNLGDAAASWFPRFYVDADVIVTADTLRRMGARLNAGDVLAASPTIRLNLDQCSWAVKAFYEIDSRMPSHRETIGGSGVYAVSEQGRRRFGKFPLITADDAFMRRQFKPQERCRVEGAYSNVTPPKALSGVIAIKTRSHYGNYEINHLFPKLRGDAGACNRPVLLRLAMQPRLWAKLAIYCYVKMIARLRARWRIWHGDRRWERDETSRQTITAGSLQ